MDGGADGAGGLADELTHLHLVANRHTGGAGLADMHGHGDHYLGRSRQALGRAIHRGVFPVMNVHAAKELVGHLRFTS